MSYPTTLNLIGGQGGSSFSFTGEKNGASLEKIGVWVGEWQVRAVRAWLSDGRKETFGKPDGPYQEYTFQAGECFTSLSLWGNGAGTRLGAIKFRTSLNKEFFVKMTKWGLKAEYPMEIGSGICLGIVGKGGADIDCMGFMFLNEVESAVLTNIKYPTINQMIPKVKVEEIKSVTYTNDSAVSQKQKIEGSKKVTKKSSWSHTNSFSTTISVEVKAGVPEVVEVSGSFGFTVGTESTYERETTDETTETWSSDIEVPPRTRVVVDISIGRCSFDLPYTGKMQITCNNGSVLEYETKGQYKGLTYSEVKINTKQFVL